MFIYGIVIGSIVIRGESTFMIFRYIFRVFSGLFLIRWVELGFGKVVLRIRAEVAFWFLIRGVYRKR